LNEYKDVPKLWAGLSDEQAGRGRYKTRSRAATFLAIAMPVSGWRSAPGNSESLDIQSQAKREVVQ
jgi:hypothetical protein